MDSPYLESGESIVLTTDRVSVSSDQYDLLLTTRYLILVDIRYALFQPQKIPLLAILSVKGGKIATGDLVITLFFSDTSRTGGSEQMNLIFSRHPGEQRERERDEWLKRLMELIVSARQEIIGSGTTSTDQKIGIQPATRRTVAPEMQPPHTTAINIHSAPIELNIIPDEPESPAFPEEEPEVEAEHAEQSVEQLPADSGAVTTSPDTVPSIEPEIIAAPASQEEPAESHGMPDATKQEVTLQDSGAMTTSPETVPPVVPEIIAAPATREEPTESPRIPDAIQPEETPPDSGVVTELPALSNREPLIVEPPTDKKEETVPAETIPPERREHAGSARQSDSDRIPLTPSSPPPPADSGSRRKSFIIIAAIIVLVLGIAGVAMVHPEYFSSKGKQLPTIPTPAVTETTVPVPPPQLTPEPTQVIIPATGVWVRVVYPQNYYGRLGNPGSLRGVNGSGDRFYQMNEDNPLIQVQMYKTDNSGDTLAVEIYRNGEVIYRRMTTSPMGFIELLIDARTGTPPGITPIITQPSNQTTTQSNNTAATPANLTSKVSNLTVAPSGNQTSQVSNQTKNQTGSGSNQVLYF